MDHTRHVIGNKRNAPAKAKLRMHSGQQWTELKSDKRLEHVHVPILCLDRGAEGESRTPTGVMPNGV